MYTWPCRQEHRHWPGVLLASLLLSVLRAHQIDEDELAHSQPQTPPPRGARGPPDPDDEEEARCHHAYIPLRRMVCGMRAGLGFCTGQDLRAVAEAAIAGMPSRIQDFQGAVAAAHAARCIANLALANADAADELVELWRCTQACSLRQPWARDQQGHMGRRCAGVGDGRAKTHGGAFLTAEAHRKPMDPESRAYRKAWRAAMRELHAYNENARTPLERIEEQEAPRLAC